ncbi:phospholipase C/P1 nuclease domain-containing protein [Russula brevipes]|nr:phospholipase C/P1 nuclease domain-containing protein [Russula brevipes]
MQTLLIAAAVIDLGNLHVCHEIVATIAQSHLDPQVLTTVCSILASDDEHAPLHFIDATGDHPGQVPLPRANVLDTIQNVSSILTDFARGSSSSAAAGAPQLVQEAPKFLVHLVGDMHQPLHLTGRARGGNSIKVLWDNRSTNLHSVWDNLLIAKAVRLTPANYTSPIHAPVLEDTLRGAIYDLHPHRWRDWASTAPRPLDVRSRLVARVPAPAAHQWAPEEQQVLVGPRKPSPAPRERPAETSDSDMLCPHAWAVPIHKLKSARSCGPRSSTARTRRVRTAVAAEATFRRKIEDDWVVEKLLAQGGVRLAGILNAIFAPQRQ